MGFCATVTHMWAQCFYPRTLQHEEEQSIDFPAFQLDNKYLLAAACDIRLSLNYIMIISLQLHVSDIVYDKTQSCNHDSRRFFSYGCCCKEAAHLKTWRLVAPTPHHNRSTEFKGGYAVLSDQTYGEMCYKYTPHVQNELRAKTQEISVC